MHTIMFLAGGFALLGVCILIAKLAGGSAAAMSKAALIFIPLWLIAAAVNMWVGVTKAGYSVKDELPVFAVVFVVPAAVAVFAMWRLSTR